MEHQGKILSQLLRDEVYRDDFTGGCHNQTYSCLSVWNKKHHLERRKPTVESREQEHFALAVLLQVS